VSNSYQNYQTRPWVIFLSIALSSKPLTPKIVLVDGLLPFLFSQILVSDISAYQPNLITTSNHFKQLTIDLFICDSK
jgi:hypothetical protein